MSKLEHDLSRYFTALDRSDPDATAPTYPVAGPARRAPSRRVFLVAACVLLVAGIAGALVVYRSSESSAPYVEIPDGWQTLTFGTIQFAVPGDWPVYTEPHCTDRSESAAYLGGLQQVCADAPEAAYSGIAVLNGLPVYVEWHEDRDPSFVAVALLDEGVVVHLRWAVAAENRELVDRIIGTIGAASDPMPVPTSTAPETTTTTRYAPEVAAYCEAIEAYQNAGVGPAPEDAPVAPGALPYLTAVREAAADEIRPPLDVVVAWLEQGSPMPTPAEVTDAAMQMHGDWVDRCTSIGR
jgi:hypothetical protein